MGRVNTTQLHKATKLPSFEPIDRQSDGWYSKRGTYHKVGGIYPWKRVKWLLKGAIGRPFGEVFSEYCQQVPYYQQQFFLEEFDEDMRTRWRNHYYIDEDGLIQRTKDENTYKGPYVYRSIDCVYEKRHKITGKKCPEFTWHLKNFKEEDYHYVLVQGWTKTFASKNDPEYKRLMTEKMTAQKKARYASYYKPPMSEEEFRKILKAKELKERAEDLVKIEAHGFDPITSFRKEKKS